MGAGLGTRVDHRHTAMAVTRWFTRIWLWGAV